MSWTIRRGLITIGASRPRSLGLRLRMIDQPATHLELILDRNHAEDPRCDFLRYSLLLNASDRAAKRDVTVVDAHCDRVRIDRRLPRELLLDVCSDVAVPWHCPLLCSFAPRIAAP